jgi:hypothetical protein
MEFDALVVIVVEPVRDGVVVGEPDGLVDCEPVADCVGAGDTDGSVD